ncbi:rRNA biogenesis protein rrp36 [Vanrija albida]|uniref:rRNA biogenesis protein RRP36 n=1 Tax=Vanrija albida TaxID=181172 RepID=A0ABR3PVM2_9TREE
MAKKSAAPLSKASKARKFADMDDDILDPDSEEDEFTNYSSKGLRGGADEDDDDEDEGSEDDDLEGGDFEADSEEEGDGVATWEPDNWDGASESESDESEGEGVQMKKLQKGLNDIPLATLMKAQKSLRRQADDSDSDGEPGPSSKENKLAAMKARLADMQRAKGKAAGVVLEEEAGPSRPRREREEEAERERQKRENKHAPTMMSTKRQVSRARQVVDVPKKASRDPRFSSLSAGQVDAHLHAQGYAFLPKLLRDELSNLRKAVTAATKAEKTCKLYEKPRFTAERERLELELARVRTKVERTERETRNREVLSAAKREEREKREQGKGAWFMKKSEKRDLLLKAKFDSLEQRGGKGAVKKAMDKKMKKVAGKEKKSRPFKAGGGGGAGREGAGEAGNGGNKRRRVA